jgi:hypothetical protein
MIHPAPTRFSRPLLLVQALSIALAAALPCTDAGASTTRQLALVDNCNDSGPGSLREAYAVVAEGIVDVSQLTCSTITLTGGPLVSAPYSGDVRIQGSATHALTIGGNHSTRVFSHLAGTLGLYFLDIADGVAHDAVGGGCVYSAGSVRLYRSTVHDCEVSTTGGTVAKGGGVLANDRVTVTASTVRDNRAQSAQADAGGGGIFASAVEVRYASSITGNTASADENHFGRGGGIDAAASVRVRYSTLSGNQAGNGGAIHLGSAASFETSSIFNSTISGNVASNAGGGVIAGRAIGLYHSTIAFNRAGFEFGAGVYLEKGGYAATTIIAGNTSGSSADPADVGGGPGSTLAGVRDLILASTIPVPPDTLGGDPLLAPLGDNGGGVLTHALLPGSPAIDAGGANVDYVATDERGVVCPDGASCQVAERQVGPAVDIGAFEFGAPDRVFEARFDVES